MVIYQSNEHADWLLSLAGLEISIEYCPFSSYIATVPALPVATYATPLDRSYQGLPAFIYEQTK